MPRTRPRAEGQPRTLAVLLPRILVGIMAGGAVGAAAFGLAGEPRADAAWFGTGMGALVGFVVGALLWALFPYEPSDGGEGSPETPR